MWVGWKEPENPDIPIKGPVHRITHSQTLTLGSDEASAAWEVQETYGESLSCVVQKRGLEGVPPLVLCQVPLQGSLQISVILPVLNFLAIQKILNVHWPSEMGLLHPMSP